LGDLSKGEKCYPFFPVLVKYAIMIKSKRKINLPVIYPHPQGVSLLKSDTSLEIMSTERKNTITMDK
jgi:hypothetical protein